MGARWHHSANCDHRVGATDPLCTTPDRVRLAYATHGTGPPLVKAANWMTHLEFDWESPVWRHWLEQLGRGHHLVRYDERGCGLSDWEVEDLSFEAWVSDLETVIDAAGLDRFPLLGISQGGAIALAYAVRAGRPASVTTTAARMVLSVAAPEPLRRPRICASGGRAVGVPGEPIP